MVEKKFYQCKIDLLLFQISISSMMYMLSMISEIKTYKDYKSVVRLYINNNNDNN